MPYSKSKRFISDFRGSSRYLLHNLNDIDKSVNYIIISKSVKDAMVLQAFGYNVTSVQNEGISIPTSIIKYLQSLYKYIYVFYDNDYNKSKNWGQIDAKELIKQYPFIKNIVIDGRYKVTDISEFICKYDEHKTKELLNKLIIKI